MPLTDPFLPHGGRFALNAVALQMPQLQKPKKPSQIEEADQRAQAHQNKTHTRDVAHGTPLCAGPPVPERSHVTRLSTPQPVHAAGWLASGPWR